jgi:hypothetical protein
MSRDEIPLLVILVPGTDLLPLAKRNSGARERRDLAFCVPELEAGVRIAPDQ